MKHKQQKKPTIKDKKSKQIGVNWVQPSTITHQTPTETITICERKVSLCRYAWESQSCTEPSHWE